jgi:LTXXQ motif family protein
MSTYGRQKSRRTTLKAPIVFFASILLFSSPATTYGQGAGSPAFESLHSDLRLNPSQEDAWRIFQQAYAVDPQEFAKQRTAEARLTSLPAPQRIDLAVDLAKASLAGLQRRGVALKVFYATLSPDQQHIFDRDTLPAAPGGAGAE